MPGKCSHAGAQLRSTLELETSRITGRPHRSTATIEIDKRDEQLLGQTADLIASEGACILYFQLERRKPYNHIKTFEQITHSSFINKIITVNKYWHSFVLRNCELKFLARKSDPSRVAVRIMQAAEAWRLWNWGKNFSRGGREVSRF